MEAITKIHPEYQYLECYDDGRIYSHKSNRFIKMNKPNSKGYYQLSICTSEYRKTVMAHRIIMEAFYGIDKTKVIDHINNNSLDNRLSNLRYCTQSENSRNRKLYKHSSSYRGVSKSQGKWKVMYTGKDKKLIYVGYFTEELEAAKAYDASVIKNNLQDYSKLNFN